MPGLKSLHTKENHVDLLRVHRTEAGFRATMDFCYEDVNNPDGDYYGMSASGSTLEALMDHMEQRFGWKLEEGSFTVQFHDYQEENVLSAEEQEQIQELLDSAKK